MDTQNRKHAYLIMAHNNFEQLASLIQLLDDPRNDIYLHIDKKVKNFPSELIQTQYAGLFYVDPICVTWGGHSQIACEMRVFHCAASKHYMYYHVLSGIDLPIKTQDEIHAFFQEHAGQNFIEIEEIEELENVLFRTQYYHLFTNIVGKRNGRLARILKRLDKYSIKLQKALRFKRKEIIPLYKGANWVSITDELIHHVLSCERLIKKQFYHSFCADEVFLQSIAMASPYRDTIVPKSYRAIDWKRGGPYTYRSEDVPDLLASSDLFARKFDVTVDPEAIRLVAAHLTNLSKS